LYFTNIEYKNPVVVFPSKFSAIKYNFTRCKYHVLLVTGIANPYPLKKYVKRFANDVELLAFPDHYYFKEKDISLIKAKYDEIKSERKIVITTEKDALRLKESPQNEIIQNIPIFYIPIEIEFLYNEKKMFNQELKEYVRKNQPISSIYSRKNKV
jgi:tetraacyldisaccharide 4'-kinase